MNGVHLGGIDLNLLVAFDALLAERSVTRAARRLGLTQPAMSHALGRLRDLLDDPILVRSGSGMLATARAEALEEPIRRALREIDDALRTGPTFDPKTSSRTFTLAIGDYGELIVLPPLLARLAREAPGIDVRVLPIPEDYGRLLEDGKVDLVVNPIAAQLAAGLVRQKLFDETFVCLVRKGHRAAKKLDLATFLALLSTITSERGNVTSSSDHERARRSATSSSTITWSAVPADAACDRRRASSAYGLEPSLFRLRAAARSRWRSSASRSR